MFLSVLGPVEYGLLKSLVEPVKIIDLTYQQMTQTLSDHFKPKPILIAEHFRFYQRNQSPGETISDYILALKRLASSCEFGTFLDDALRDKFVCGLTGEIYHRRLLSEKDLTFKKACDIALALELAHKDTKELGAQATIKDTSVHKVQNAFGAKEKYRGRGSSQFNTKNGPSSNLLTGIKAAVTVVVEATTIPQNAVTEMKNATIVEKSDTYSVHARVIELSVQQKPSTCQATHQRHSVQWMMNCLSYSLFTLLKTRQMAFTSIFR